MIACAMPMAELAGIVHFGVLAVGLNATQVLKSSSQAMISTQIQIRFCITRLPTGTVKSDAQGSDLSMSRARRW